MDRFSVLPEGTIGSIRLAPPPTGPFRFLMFALASDGETQILRKNLSIH